jgi:hypothetical protein
MMAEKKSRFSCNNNYDRVPTTIHSRPLCRALWMGVIAGRYCRALLQGIIDGRYCVALLQGIIAGHYRRALLRCIIAGRHCGMN